MAAAHESSSSRAAAARAGAASVSSPASRAAGAAGGCGASLSAALCRQRHPQLAGVGGAAGGGAAQASGTPAASCTSCSALHSTVAAMLSEACTPCAALRCVGSSAHAAQCMTCLPASLTAAPHPPAPTLPPIAAVGCGFPAARRGRGAAAVWRPRGGRGPGAAPAAG